MVRSDFLTVTRDDAPTPGAVLMERDATAFARAEAAGGCAPSLRWFRWDRPTLSLGRGQDAGADVDLGRCTADGVPVVVRPTGGRAVFHVDEWTYAALVPLSHATLGGSLRDSCRALVSLVAAALARAYDVRVDRATAAGEPSTGPSAAATRIDRVSCFGRAFGHELTVGGRKLMGSAQRRGRHVLLQQGSLLVGPGQEQVARYLAAGAGAEDVAGAEAHLAAGTTHLSALLGGRPSADAFFAALADLAERGKKAVVGARLS